MEDDHGKIEGFTRQWLSREFPVLDWIFRIEMLLVNLTITTLCMFAVITARKHYRTQSTTPNNGANVNSNIETTISKLTRRMLKCWYRMSCMFTIQAFTLMVVDGVLIAHALVSGLVSGLGSDHANYTWSFFSIIASIALGLGVSISMVIFTEWITKVQIKSIICVLHQWMTNNQHSRATLHLSARSVTTYFGFICSITCMYISYTWPPMPPTCIPDALSLSLTLLRWTFWQTSHRFALAWLYPAHAFIYWFEDVAEDMHVASDSDICDILAVFGHIVQTLHVNPEAEPLPLVYESDDSSDSEDLVCKE